MKILVATDGSEQSDAAVAEMARRPFPPNTEIHVVSAFQGFAPPAGVSMGAMGEFYAEADQAARNLSQSAVERATKTLRASNPAPQVTTAVIEGWPKQVILDEAKAFGADLIVIGSHGYGMLERFRFGSVSQAMALHAKCSVEIVRSPKKGEVMRILLAIDGSDHSHAAVAEIARQHFPTDSEVRVISVIEPPYLTTTYPGQGVSVSLYEEIEKTSRERARAAVEKAAANLRADDGSRQLNVTTEVLSGSPKVVILDEAEAFGADLIVVGSHGHGMLERFLLGSVSQAVALHAKCSVEIVRSPKTQTSEDIALNKREA